MEIGWWGGPGSSDDEGENAQLDAEPGVRPGTPGAEDAPEEPARAKPAAAKPRATKPQVDEPGTDAPEAEPLAKVSYLPWAAPGVDVTAESGIGSAAFRRPWVEPELELSERGFDASATVALPRQLAEPGDWTEEYSDEADDEDEVEEFDPGALERALLKKLARRDMSIVEVEQFLEQNGLPAEQLEEWVERMMRLGYLDDLRLAENVIDQLRRRKGLGASSIKQELNRRRISPAIVSEALGESDQDEERARAMELAVKRAGQLSSYDDATAERRLTGFLMRKGYGSGVVRDAVKAALAARKRPAGGVRFR